MPVSEVGDAVVGRGFALLHNGSRSVDTADHPWTLDNPAYGWFGLSSAARVRVGDGVRAVSVAEVVAPTEPMGGLLARDLVVALVRGRGHGDLQQRRQAPLRPPRRRLQPAGRPHRAGRAGPERLHQGRAGRRRSGLHRRGRAAARRHRSGQGVGAGRGAVGGRLDPRRRPAGFAGAAGAGDRQPRRRRPRAGDRVGGRRPRRRRDRRQPAGAVGPAALRARTPSRCSTAGCPASPSRPTARCTPR